MARIKMQILIFVILFFFLSSVYAERKPYIVYLGDHAHGRDASLADYELATESHHNLLGSFIGGKERAKEAMTYSYTRSINGFAAHLEDSEAAEIAKHPQVISIFPNGVRSSHTTHSWDLLGLERNGTIPHQSLWTKSWFGEDTIIANLDMGVWPESESFNDEGMGPVPSRWKGFCQNNTKEGVMCNRKLIGSRYFNAGPLALSHKPLNHTYFTPRDLAGHGTHTLSTAGGRLVPNANIFGQAKGTAKGGSPGARVAAYKVCWPPLSSGRNDDECYDIDMLAGMDAAIDDGVDVISVSLGGAARDYFDDGLAIGAFHALRNGIVVVCSAGNDGPAPETATNLAPWIITVGASTLDREFVSYVTLGNGKSFKGLSLSDKKLPANNLFPLIKSEDAAHGGVDEHSARLCMKGSLDPKKVKGKIVVCLRGINQRMEKSETVRLAGGAGMIHVNAVDNLTDPYGTLYADPFHLPATHISHLDGIDLYSYINSTSSPAGSILPTTTEYAMKPNPRIAGFTSRGPNVIDPEVLKPDIAAPGVDVLAAISQAPSVNNGNPYETRLPPFNLMSGTSMACPHVSGIVGLLRSLHPEWSPAMIRSAIMTTARTQDNTGEPMKDEYLEKATPFSYGAGQVQPNRAMDPGLVYDLKTEDYLDFLCSKGYNSTQLAYFSKDPFTCPTHPINLENFNYPSISIPNLRGRITVKRTLKNVGKPGAYVVRVKEPEGFAVSVHPKKLKFESFGEEKTFKISVKAKCKHGEDYQFGMLLWSDGTHTVRSPIVIKSKA